MCSSLSDFFACIRAQGNVEADSTSSTHQRNNADLDDEPPDLQPKQEQIRQRSDTTVAQHHDSLPVPPPAGSPSTDYLRPSLRPARVSYEALERYYRIYGRSRQDAGSSGSVRNISDQF
ncbi:uncharacterized protein LOC6555799 [Drosophila erecta]|uniref:Uncharacterized protein n=1 Tax=Drosophila erecta TaxID=7220 RepID=B3P9A9_DROER|nr:uncharacterized protein LOC6555799 [Drosophila erecta]EDV45405.1 uncharacterized protein Dere_GG12813 [Drosophila erecta]